MQQEKSEISWNIISRKYNENSVYVSRETYTLIFSAENNYCNVLIEHSCLNNLKINIVSRETSAINFSIYLIKMLRHCCKFYKKLMVNRK